MIGKPIRLISFVLALAAALFISACGTVATPEWAADAQATNVAAAETFAYETSIAPTATFTNTPVPPTATATPPPLPTNTPSPTQTTLPATETPVPVEPTTEVTAEATEAVSGDSASAVSPEFAAAAAAADPALGATAFQLMRPMPDGAVWSCNLCHSVTPDEMILIGPGLWNVAQRGAEIPGYSSALDYIYTSITHPNDFIQVRRDNGMEFTPNLMPQHYANPEVLPPEEFEAIVAYLYTLQDVPATPEIPGGASEEATTEAAASGGGESALTPELIAAVEAADPALGATAFQQMRPMPDGAVWSCNLCHSVTPDEMILIGPGLWNVSVRGAEIPGYDSALAYIYASITHPNDFIQVRRDNGMEFTPNLMPAHYANPEVLPPAELEAIMAYLLTLHD